MLNFNFILIIDVINKSKQVKCTNFMLFFMRTD
jgi:hypothetical protein